MRYRVGDIVAIENGECGQCGRTGPRFTSDPYRADGLVKVKGTLVDPQALHGSLSPLLSVDGVSDYQLRIWPRGRIRPLFGGPPGRSHSVLAGGARGCC